MDSATFSTGIGRIIQGKAGGDRDHRDVDRGARGSASWPGSPCGAGSHWCRRRRSRRRLEAVARSLRIRLLAPSASSDLVISRFRPQAPLRYSAREQPDAVGA